MELVGEKAVKLMLPEHLGKLVTDTIPQSEILNTEDERSSVVVYWGLDEMTQINKLMRLKNNLPSPMRRDYSYPGLYKPFDHQAVTAEFLSINEKAFCFNEAGTGKTSSALWAADYLMEQGKIKKVLIICPLSIMYSAWQGDVFNTCMHRSSVVCHGPAHKRKAIIEGDYDFTIINYDGVNIVKDEIRNADYDLIIIDECNAYKSHTT
jgi:SNF2 family DNA or RNA helicase